MSGLEGRLPAGWPAIEESMLETALRQALRAFGDDGVGIDRAIHNLSTYYDPEGGYAGTLFLGIPDRDPNAITPEDLLAVSTLSMKIPARVTRILLGQTDAATKVEKGLGALKDLNTSLASASFEDLEHMWSIHDAIRTIRSTAGESGEDANKWVLASKLCARKRPRLFPVRDSKVCAYLADNPSLGGGQGQLGWFRRDLQVFAYLIGHPEIRERLDAVRHAMPDTHPIDREELRLLDSVLWMRAVA